MDSRERIKTIIAGEKADCCGDYKKCYNAIYANRKMN